MKPGKTLGTLLAVVLLGCMITQCTEQPAGEPVVEETPSEDADYEFLNMADGVEYVGMETCKGCHFNIYKTYIKTGMGQSFDDATRQKSAGVYDHTALVYDSANNFYYQPFWQNDSLFVKEFRLEGRDTVHQRIDHISYIIGSGQHTNSHLVDFGGYVYQAPITFYTQDKRWDLAPGFEGGYNTRYTRMIGHECMTCHNALPKFEEGSYNQYASVPHGIDCERCHGPGGLHVKEKLAGKLVDTSKYADYTIVNPGRLGKHRQMSLCQRCHLQGVAVLNDGQNWDDFKPGMHLREVMQVYLPRFEGAENDFIMASQADRLRMSDCYKMTDMTCITCHNPHVTVKATPIETFNAACTNCHRGNEQATSQLLCSESETARAKMDNNCSGCHMPKSGSIDIPHVSISDHYIRKNYSENASLTINEVENIKRFMGLESRTDDTHQPTAYQRALGYLSFYEKFSQRPYVLDSAKAMLGRSGGVNAKTIEGWVSYYFLAGQYSDLVRVAVEVDKDAITDGWTLYRVGEAYYQLQDFNKALGYYRAAMNIGEGNLEFMNKVGAALSALNRFTEAAKVYEQVLGLQRKFLPALSNLGYIKAQQGDMLRAENLLKEALSLDPDYELALQNLAMVYLQKGEMDLAKNNVIPNTRIKTR